MKYSFVNGDYLFYHKMANGVRSYNVLFSISLQKNYLHIKT